MRLDEWQKYIEAQFLDDVESAVNPVQPPLEVSAETAVAVAAPTSTSPNADISRDDEADERSDPTPVVQAVVSPPPSPVMPPVEVLPPTLPSSSPDLTPRSVDAGRLEFMSGLSTLTELDVTIPDFDSYLPSSHPGARTVQSLTPQADEESRLNPPIEESQLQTTVAPSGEGNGLDSQIEATQPNPKSKTQNPNSNAPVPASDTQTLKRNPRSRARHARNVRPDQVPSGLSAGELWAKVPKHVHTLLALERLEEEQEVAQFSYKRPFQEKRHELIERLLDPILSLEDTARLLNVCPTTVRRYTNKGILTYYRKEPDRAARSGSLPHDTLEDESSLAQAKETRQRRFRLSDILAFLETQQAALDADRKAEAVGTLRKRRTHLATETGSTGSDNAEHDPFAPNLSEKAERT